MRYLVIAENPFAGANMPSRVAIRKERSPLGVPDVAIDNDENECDVSEGRQQPTLPGRNGRLCAIAGFRRPGKDCDLLLCRHDLSTYRQTSSISAGHMSGICPME